MQWVMAWGKLDLCYMGDPAWSLPNSWKRKKTNTNKMQHEQAGELAVADMEQRSYIWTCEYRMDFFQVRHYKACMGIYHTNV